MKLVRLNGIPLTAIKYVCYSKLLLLQMSRWDKLLLHPCYERIRNLYEEEEFPIQVRALCDKWIEGTMTAVSNCENIESTAGTFFMNLIRELNKKKSTLLNIPIKYRPRIDEFVQVFSGYLPNPTPIFLKLRDIMAYEQHFVPSR